MNLYCLNHYPVILLIASWLTHADPKLARESRTFDQMTIILNAVSLLLAGVLAFVAWGVFFMQFNPMHIALPLAGLVAAIVFRVDQAMASSDWELAGVLRQGPLPGSWYWKLAARVAVAWLLAYGTALGLVLAFFSDSITQHIQQNRASQNTVIEQEYAQLKDDVRQRLVAPLVTELTALSQQRSQMQVNLQQNLSRQGEALTRASSARIEADREMVGGRVGGSSYVPGEGPRWAEAQRQQREADRLSAQTESQIGSLNAQMQVLQSRVDEKTTQLRLANQDYESQRLALDAQKLHDPRFLPVRDDPLMRYMALSEMENDPISGPAVRKFGWIAQALLLTLELAFLLTKVVFAPASVYMVRLITTTKLEAARVVGGYGADRDELRHQRPPLRVVPREGEPLRPEYAHQNEENRGDQGRHQS